MGISKKTAAVLYGLTVALWLLLLLFLFKLTGRFDYPGDENMVLNLRIWRNVCFACAVVCTIVSVIIGKLINEINSEMFELRQRILMLEKEPENRKL